MKPPPIIQNPPPIPLVPPVIPNTPPPVISPTQSKNGLAKWILSLFVAGVVVVGVIALARTFVSAVRQQPSLKITQPAPPSHPSPIVKPKLSEEHEALIADLTSRRVIRIDSSERKGWIDPFFWATLNAEKKESLVELMAAKCASDKGDTMASIDVFDMQTAKQIAEFGPFSGFKVY